MLCSAILIHRRKSHASVKSKTKGGTSVGDINHVLSSCRCSMPHAEKPNGCFRFFFDTDILHHEEVEEKKLAKSFLKSVKVTFVLHISSHILCSVTFMWCARLWRSQRCIWIRYDGRRYRMPPTSLLACNASAFNQSNTLHRMRREKTGSSFE